MGGKRISDLKRILIEDYRLATAEILYRFPDHPSLLQTYVWQDLDLTPDFPVLKKFLHFWEKEIEGKLFSVKVTSCELVKAAEYHNLSSVIRIH
ncbi:MAG: aspartate-semialdehyde dehydrogenase [Rickettsiales bacterium]